MSKIAVIKTGGKQYKVAEGDKIQIEKIEGKEGKKIDFKDVLLVADEKGADVKIGDPVIKGAKVSGTIENGKVTVLCEREDQKITLEMQESGGTVYHTSVKK